MSTLNIFEDNHFIPIIKGAIFINGDFESLITFFIEWQTPLVGKHGNAFLKKPVHGVMANLCDILYPLTVAESRKYLFVKLNNEWTLIFDDSRNGTDTTMSSYLAKQLKTLSFSMRQNPSTGEAVLAYRDHRSSEPIIRWISVTNEGSWRFEMFGPVQPFENSDDYGKRRVRDRFSSKSCIEILTKANIPLPTATIIIPDGDAYLLEKSGPPFKATRFFNKADI